MFSALKEGSIVYILEKSNGLKFKIANVVSVSSPQFTNGSYSSLNPFGGVINIKVDIDGVIEDFGNLPANQNKTYYDNGKITISESRDEIINEIENVIQNSKNIINSIDYHNNVIKDGENILKDINPIFAKEKARDEEILNLHNRINNMDSKLDKLITVLSKSEK